MQVRYKAGHAAVEAACSAAIAA